MAKRHGARRLFESRVQSPYRDDKANLQAVQTLGNHLRVCSQALQGLRTVGVLVLIGRDKHLHSPLLATGWETIVYLLGSATASDKIFAF